MIHAIRTTVALGPMADRDQIEAACLGEPGIAITGFVQATPDHLDSLSEYPDDALVVACNEDSEDVLRFIQGALELRPNRPIVVLYHGSANGFVREAFEAGADDLVNSANAAGPALGRDLAFALEKAVARRSGAGGTVATGEDGEPGTMIGVLGPKGGTGKTLTACNLAVALAEAGHRVVIVDLDLQFGDIGLAMGLAPERTLYDLATSGGSLDSEKLDDYLATHESGVRVMMAPRRPDHAGAIGVEFLRGLFSTLRTMTDYVIVDTPPGFTPEVIAAIDRSTHLCVVAMLDALSLKNTKLALETLDLMEYDHDRIKVVLNRADSKVGVTPGDVTALLGREPDVLIPSHRDITRSVNEATPIVGTTGNIDARRAFHQLAAAFVPAGVRGGTKGVNGGGSAPAATPAKKSGGFGAMLRRKGG